jgi:DNA modification methylase
LLAAGNLGRKAYGFEVNKEYVKGFYDKLYPLIKPDMFVQKELEEIKKQREQQRRLFDK